MARWLVAGCLVARWLEAGVWVAGGWWLVAWWLVAGGWWLWISDPNIHTHTNHEHRKKKEFIYFLNGPWGIKFLEKMESYS